MFTKRYFNAILRAENEFGFTYNAEESLVDIYDLAWNVIMQHSSGKLPEVCIACEEGSTSCYDEDGYEYLGRYPDLTDEKIYYISNPNYREIGDPEYIFSRKSTWGPEYGERTLLGKDVDINGKVVGILSARMMNDR